MAATTSTSMMLSRFSGSISSLWIANGVVFVFLLGVWPLRRRTWHLACAFLGNVLIGVLGHYPLAATLTSAGGNIAEISILLALTGKYYDRGTGKFRITAPRFTLYTCGTVATVCLCCYALPMPWRPGPDAVSLLNFFCGDVLGMLIVAALTTHLRSRDFWPEFQPGRRLGTWFCLFAVASISLLIFSQNPLPLLFVMVSVLIYVVFERGLAIATLSLFVLGVISTIFTMHSLGPIPAIPGLTLVGKVVYLQVFLFILLATVYPVGRALYKQERLQTLYTLLADNSRDIISRSTPHGVRLYCSPSVSEVLGWTPREMINMPVAHAIHPEDREAYSAVLKGFRMGQSNAVLRYRARTRSGDFLWMEGHFRVILDPLTGKPAEIIATSRDISARVAAEEELQAAYRNLERLASTDALTGLANRRIFDETLEREWRRAMRDRTPIALLLLDVDYFKKYNDTLGHPAGDECLRRIARCLGEIVQRPGDLAGRYGGEEFVALLPVTDESGALHIASRIAEAVAELGISHPASPLDGKLSMSIGIASVVPEFATTPDQLIEAADKALYAAKRNGRARIELAAPPRNTLAGDRPLSHQ